MTTPPLRSGAIGVTSSNPASRSPVFNAVASSTMRASICAIPRRFWNATVVATAARAASSRWPSDSNLRAPRGRGATLPPQLGATMLGQISATRSART